MNKLEELEVDEVSLVDAGANPEAHIVLFKRKEEKSMAKENPTAEVAKQEEKKMAADVTEQAAKNLTAELETVNLKRRVAELEKILAERDSAGKAELEKAVANNAALAEAIERVNKRMEEHIEKAEDAELMKVAAKYELLGENAGDTFKLLKSLKGTEGYDLLIGTFDKALEQMEKSGMFDEVGKRGRDSGGSIEELTKKFMSEDSKLSERQARDKAFVTLGIYE